MLSTIVVLAVLSTTTITHGFQIHNGNGRVVFRNRGLSSSSSSSSSMGKPYFVGSEEEDHRMQLAKNIVNADTWSKQAAAARKELEDLEKSVSPSTVELGSIAESEPEVVMRLSEEEKRMQWAMRLQECKPELAMKAEQVQQALNELSPDTATPAAATTKQTSPTKRITIERKSKARAFATPKLIPAY